MAVCAVALASAAGCDAEPTEDPRDLLPIDTADAGEVAPGDTADAGEVAPGDTAESEVLSCEPRNWRAAVPRVVMRDARPLLRCVDNRTLLAPRVLGDLPEGYAQLWRYDVVSGALSASNAPPICDGGLGFLCGFDTTFNSTLQSLPTQCDLPFPEGPDWIPHQALGSGAGKATECVTYDVARDLASPESLFTVEKWSGIVSGNPAGTYVCSYSGTHFRRLTCRTSTDPGSAAIDFQEVQRARFMGQHLAVLHDRDPVFNASKLTIVWDTGERTSFDGLVVTDFAYDPWRDVVVLVTVAADGTLELRTANRDGTSALKLGGLRPLDDEHLTGWFADYIAVSVLEPVVVAAGTVLLLGHDAADAGDSPGGLLMVDLDAGTSTVLSSRATQFDVAMPYGEACSEPTPWAVTYAARDDDGQWTQWLHEPVRGETRALLSGPTRADVNDLQLRGGVVLASVVLRPRDFSGRVIDFDDGSSVVLATDTTVPGGRVHRVGAELAHAYANFYPLDGERTIVTSEPGATSSGDSPTFTTGRHYYLGRVAIQHVDPAFETDIPQAPAQEFGDASSFSLQCGECLYVLQLPEGEKRRGFDVLEVCPAANP